jgi:hypothetical protein
MYTQQPPLAHGRLEKAAPLVVRGLSAAHPCGRSTERTNTSSTRARSRRCRSRRPSAARAMRSAHDLNRNERSDYPSPPLLPSLSTLLLPPRERAQAISAAWEHQPQPASLSLPASATQSSACQQCCVCTKNAKHPRLRGVYKMMGCSPDVLSEEKACLLRLSRWRRWRR